MTAPTVTEEGPLRFTMAGRTFRDAGRMMSAAQDQWVAPHLHATGLYDYLTGGIRMDGDDPAAFFRDLILRMQGSGKLLHVAAGLVEEEGRPVPDHPDDLPAFMDERLRFFGGLRDPADRATLHRYLMELVLRFFGSGLASLETFRTSFPDREPFEVATSSAEAMSVGQ